MRRVFLSFADTRLHRSAQRLAAQACSLNFFDEIVILNENDLSAEFAELFSDVLVPTVRGFGYWCWKPQIVLQTLERLEFGDIIQYSDIGCHLNPGGRQRLEEYFEIASNCPSGILGFEASYPQAPFPHDGREIPDWPDAHWAKGDLIDYLGVRDRLDILHSPTIQSGVFLLKKTPAVVQLITAWRDTYIKNFALADDSQSKSSNFPGFVEHRHDQSIFSLLCKLSNACTLSASEFWYPLYPGRPEGDWETLRNFPIHAKRDLDFGIFGNFNRRIELEKAVMKKRIKSWSSNLANRAKT